MERQHKPVEWEVEAALKNGATLRRIVGDGFKVERSFFPWQAIHTKEEVESRGPDRNS